MVCRSTAVYGLLVLGLCVVAGCGLYARQAPYLTRPASELDTASLQIEYPDAGEHPSADVEETLPPLELDNPPEFWDLSLEDAIHSALANTRVLRDLGGTILEVPNAATTIYDPALVDSDPRFGVEAALSAFDASLAANAFFEKNDRPLNNIFEGGGTRLFRQDLDTYGLELSKQSAVGTDIAVRSASAYNFNNAPGNARPNLPWDQRLEFEVRQPLLQGAGVEFNRIAGPNSTPGFYNGVLIARVDTDISLAEFERAVQGLVSDVENAYWELYFAYRDLDAKIDARARALRTWREINALYGAGQRGGEAEQEWQAREQYFRLDAEVQDALYGRVIEKSTTNNFRGYGGVLASERRLRLAMGIRVSDGRLIRPSDEPTTAEIEFDWDELAAECVERRVELRRQRWQIKRRELEVLAARNFTLPRLDAVAGYRLRGLGHDWLDSRRDGRSRFDNAWMNLTSGDFQEWQLGVDLSVPLGNRQAFAAVRSAELQLARQRAILAEQQRQILNDLNGAVAEKQRAYRLARVNLNRRIAAREQLAALEAIYTDADESEKIRLLDLLLDAQRRLADAESQYHRALAEHMVAVKNVHFEKGSLLDFDKIQLAEGLWPTKAYHDAAGRLAEHSAGHSTHGALQPASPWPVVSRGPYVQDLEPVGDGSVLRVVPEDIRTQEPPPVPGEPLPPPL
jgi:outer membrane protein TolC